MCRLARGLNLDVVLFLSAAWRAVRTLKLDCEDGYRNEVQGSVAA